MYVDDITFSSEAMLAAGLADETSSGSRIGTGSDKIYNDQQTKNHDNRALDKRGTRPFAVPLTNHPCIQSEIPYSSP